MGDDGVRDVATLLGGIAGGAVQDEIAGGVGGSFAFDEDSLRDLIKDWLDLADNYSESLMRSQRMALVDGPGLEFASEAQAEAANQHGRAYLAYLEHNRDYCLRQAQLLQNALDDYLGVEHRNVTDIENAGPQAGI